MVTETCAFLGHYAA